MSVESNDWLDRQLAAKEHYIPDDGFTANVVDRLPKQRRATAVQIRTRVLTVTGVVAFALFVLLLIPLVRQMPVAMNHLKSPELRDHINAILMQPSTMVGIAVAILALLYVSLPLLRRIG